MGHFLVLAQSWPEKCKAHTIPPAAEAVFSHKAKDGLEAGWEARLQEEEWVCHWSCDTGKCQVGVAKKRAQEGSRITAQLGVCPGFPIQEDFCFSFRDCSIWNVSMQGCPKAFPGHVTPISRLLKRWVVLSQERLQLQFVTDQTHLPLGFSRRHPQAWAVSCSLSRGPCSSALRAARVSTGWARWHKETQKLQG